MGRDRAVVLFHWSCGMRLAEGCDFRKNPGLLADKDGLSYWGDARGGGTLKLPIPEIERAREGLVRQGLLAYERPLYQVLDLAPPPPRREGGPRSLAEILRQIASSPPEGRGPGEGRGPCEGRGPGEGRGPCEGR